MIIHFLVVIILLASSLASAQFEFLVGQLTNDTRYYPELPLARDRHTLVVDKLDRIWMYGGANAVGDVGGQFGNVYRFDASKRKWQWIDGSNSTGLDGYIEGKPRPRHSHASWIENGHMYVFGGHGMFVSYVYGALSDFWVFNTTTNNWIFISGSLTPFAYPTGFPETRFGMGNWVDGRGGLYIFGGSTRLHLSGVEYFDESYFSTTWRFDTINGNWTALTAPGPSPRMYSSCTNDADGNAYCFGGYGEDSVDRTSLGYLADLWKMDISGKWALLDGNTRINSSGTLPNRPAPISGSLLLFSKFRMELTLMFGGNSGRRVSDVWRYSLSSNPASWTFLRNTNASANAGPNPMPANRVYAAGAVLSTDLVVIYGGWGDQIDYNAIGVNSDAWIYRQSPPCSKGTVLQNGYCELCPAGSISIVTNAATCFGCPAGTFASMPGSAYCENCSSNTFSSKPGSTSCTSCGSFLVSAVGSASCVCPAGYFASGTGCVQCPSGTFKSTLGNETCKNCEANSFSGIGATVCTICGPNSVSGSGASECTCLYGHEPTGSYGCAPCAPGTAKQTIGNTPCNKCPAGQYSSGSGALVCLPCSQNTVSSLGSSSCSCSPGYEPSGSNCSQCSAGKVKASSGNSSCVDCPVNQYSLPGSTYCTCAPGYFQDGGNCSPCWLGSYKAELGNYSCTQCSPGFFQNSTAAIASCFGCPAGTYQDKFAQSTCIQCRAGSYSNTTQATSSTTCIQCPENTYSGSVGATNVSACQPCAGNATTNGIRGSSSCVCMPGFEGDGSISCSACPINTFKDTFSNTNCLSCGINATTNGQTASRFCFCPSMYFGNPKVACSRCPTGKVRIGLASSVTTELDCTIAPKCRAGTYGDPIESCIECPIDTYREGITELVTTVKDCKPCAQNSGTNGLTGAGIASQCLCFPGYFGSGAINTCAPCPANTFKSANNNTDACTLCPENSSTGGNIGSISINACVCNSGYTGTSETGCLACAPGSFKAGMGPDSCSLCTPGTFQATSAQLICLRCGLNTSQSEFGKTGCNKCTNNAVTPFLGSSICYCPANYYGNPATGCFQCPSGTSRDGATFLSTRITDCMEAIKCDPGYYGNPAMSCLKCPVNTYKSEISFRLTTVNSCIKCPQSSTTNGKEGSLGLAECLCDAGFYGSAATSCQKCPSNTFKDKPGNSASCTACPSHSVSNEEALSCQCDAGYFRNGRGTCVPCPKGTFKVSIGDDNVCISCNADTYSSFEGAISSTVCSPCPLELTTNGSVGSTSCDFCAAGFEGVPPNCFACLDGFKKQNIGNGECVPSGNADSTEGVDEGLSSTALYAIVGTAGGVLILGVAIVIAYRREKNSSDDKIKSVASTKTTIPLSPNMVRNVMFAPIAVPNSNSGLALLGMSNYGGSLQTMSSQQDMTKTMTLYDPSTVYSKGQASTSIVDPRPTASLHGFTSSATWYAPTSKFSPTAGVITKSSSSSTTKVNHSVTYNK